MMENNAIGRSWDEVRKELYTPEEILESDIRVALISEIIEARKAAGLSQNKLAELSNVRQPIISRLENLETSPNLDTIVKLLLPLGKTLAIVPLEK